MRNDVEILLVEDDPDTRANLRDILELDGHRVVFAASAGEARVVLENHSFWLIILDRRLPDATAEDFLPKLRRLAPRAEIVVVTGYADMNGTIAAMRHGAADYLLKPINPEALRSCLIRLLQRRKIETDLQQEQQFADQILETAEAVILVLDSEGRIVRFNHYFERISGWALSDVIGTDWFSLCIREDDREWLSKVFIQTASGARCEGIVNPIITKQGRERHIRWANAALAGERGLSNAVLAVGVDVTDLLSAQARALQAERLAAIGQTMTGLAHESRNALQRIQAGLELLQVEIGEQSEGRRDLDSIQRATDDLNSLLEEVRSFAAPIHLHREEANLQELWRSIWRRLETAAQPRDIELIDAIDGDPTAKIDILRIEQVFRNLFENAIAACSDPVRVSVTCCCNNGDEIEIVVQDNGPGLTGEQREKIFEPFYTTKSTGTGLGTSIVQRIVEAHGGMISIGGAPVDKPGTGATFIIRLPRTPSHAPASDSEALYDNKTKSRKATP